jgi:hypothetical protein
VTLQRVSGGGRRRVAPQPLDEALRGHRIVPAQEQRREERALLSRRERQLAAVTDDPDRPQEAELDHRSIVRRLRRVTRGADRCIVARMNGGTHWEPKDFPGAIWLYPSEIAPVGWALCDGSEFDPAKYPELAKILPSGTLPNLKGQAPRGVWFIISLGAPAS